VIVPFGKGNKELSGYIIEITDQAQYSPEKLKEILAVSDLGMLAESGQIRLAAWMKERYGSTMITALKTVLPVRKRANTPQKRRIVLGVSGEEAAQLLAQCRRKHQSARVRLLERLCEKGEITYEEAVGELALTSASIKSMAEKGIVTVVSEISYRNPVVCKGEIKEKPVLNEAQRTIVSEILTEYKEGRPGTYLIHGITGSGKTEVYMELIDGVVRLGKQAIVLIPEIALTYQTVSRFAGRFGERVSVLHSRLSAGEKYDQCERAKKGEIDIIIGPRSALFTPFSKLGLIIIDEEHEASYKSESMPKYHAREAAAWLASYYGASVVLGSATPSLESYAASEKGLIKRYELTQRPMGGSLPEVYVEDLRKELKCGNRSIFSRRLQQLLEQRLSAGEQSMLFLNRRGYAGFVSCRACGHVMKCPHCDVSLSEHKGGRLVCHYCGYEQPSVKICPACGSKYILGFRAGTQQIEELLHKCYPQARVLRMDADTTRKKGSYDKILAAFANGEADILIGTQMIIKGHDFPNVTLVGILAADLSLHAGDYRAGERTFQLLTQAAGRAGRGTKPGEVVIQTYQPEHHSVRYAAKQDYKGFYTEEMGYRELLAYPPAAHMLAVLVLSETQDGGMALAGRLAELAKQDGKPADGQTGIERDGLNRCVQLIGPAAASIGRIGDQYRTVFYAKSADMEALIGIKDTLEEFLERQALCTESVQFDFDPMNGY
ncbi:MAG: primosomal protein N', partial [Lachnospiraceae bacterium]|nr:primosomal protein N' [Lachnospiraceae bacterium]